ncbi:autotransporter outer membrane beta-barrel domain-containing protein [Campylobacter jejuni]|uniref:autotransporter outer membrane beta-barrel domain-containing protein n=1 Tax=Campylobacter jejuni TaxID=197 RepID=UPI0005760231|nr:autotransporter outer membrane beta-barrel domain-containing protein [Campylobacter jejuni]
MSDASANNNTVEIHNGNFTQTIYGGYSKDGEALGNNVILAGGKISGDVYASAGKTTVSGVITLREGVDVSSANLHSGVILTDLPFYGMLTLSHAAAPMPLNVKADSNGNNSVLEIDGFSGSVNTLSGFDTIDFKNAVWQKNGSPVLNITDAESSGFKNETKVRVQRITIPNDVDVKEGSLLSLFSDNINGKTNALLQNSSVDIFKGTTLAGMASLNSKNASVDAKIEKLGLNPQTLLVAENRAVASAFANQGSDLIADKLDSLRHLKDGNLSVFTNAYGNASEYNTQSEFKINGYTSSFGVGYASAFDNFDLSLLAFYENSTGRYRTYNSFDGEIFMGFGEINANGGGLASRFDFNNGLYTEASFRAGRLNASMQNALRDINGKFYNYDLNSAYYGMHIGIGRVFDFNPIFDLDVYSKFFYTHTSKDSFNVDDEIFQLDSVTSERVRVGLKSNAAINENLKAYAGLAYEYEFNGSANMKVAGYAFNEQSLKGSSYAAEFGVNYQVIKSLNLDFKGRTYLGKRKGVDGTLGLNYQF